MKRRAGSGRDRVGQGKGLKGVGGTIRQGRGEKADGCGGQIWGGCMWDGVELGSGGLGLS